jgi:membrane-bound lytic murein transglycosylase D
MNLRSTLATGVVFAFLFISRLIAQVPINVGNTIEFGGIVASLDERGRSRLQLEVNRLYANRAALTAQLEQLRQLDPFIQEALKKAGLPADYRHLALPLDAAQGYWTIPQPLVSRLGLRTTPRIDERLHPLLATEAAVVHLARDFSRTANAFRTAVNYLQTANGNNTERLSGTGNFLVLDANSPANVWKLLARRLVFNYEDSSFRPSRTFVLWSDEASGGRQLTDIAFQYNLPTDRLEPYAAWLRGPVVPGDSLYRVLIRMTPEEYAKAIGQRYRSGLDTSAVPPEEGFPVLRRQAPVNSELNTPITLYEINSLPGIQAQPGDNVITLAFYGKLAVKQFMEYNDLTAQDVVRPGEIYYLAPKRKRASIPFHVTNRGQTIRDVSNQYGVRLKNLLDYNDIEANQRVPEGRVLWLQKRRPRNQPVEYRQLPLRPQPPAPLPDSTQTPVDSVDVVSNVPGPVSKDSVVIVDPVPTPSVAASVASATVATPASNSVAAPRVRVHVVRPGETFFGLARQYNIPLKELYRLNDLPEGALLRVDQRLLVAPTGVPIKAAPVRKTPSSRSALPKLKPAPGAKSAPRPKSRPREQGLRTYFRIEPVLPAVTRPGSATPTSNTVTAPTEVYYTVQPGQTVYRVALINNVTVEEVMRWNNLRDYTIQVGQRLVIRR